MVVISGNVALFLGEQLGSTLQDISLVCACVCMYTRVCWVPSHTVPHPRNTDACLEQEGAGPCVPEVAGEVSVAEPCCRVRTLDFLRGSRVGLRPRGLERGGRAEPTKVVREGCLEEVELEGSLALELGGEKREERVQKESH